MTDFEGYDQAIRLIEHNKSLRMIKLEKLGAWVTGNQYDGRPGWWDDSSGKPLWERAPCIVYPVCAIAINSNSDLMMGDARFPEFTFKPGEDSSEDEGGLNESDSEVADKTLAEYHKLSRFRAHCRESFESAQGCGTSVSIHGARNGKPFVDSMPAKWCEVERDGDGNVTKLTVQYPYLETYRLRNKWACRAMLYRRIIDEQNDTTYLPAECTEAGPDGVSWSVDFKNTRAHGLGFCPVIWYAHMRGSAAFNVVDGNAIQAQYLDEIQAHDIALSQKHRGALYSEPQICEIGVTKGSSPTATGRKPLVAASVSGGELNAANPPKGNYHDSSGGNVQEARKKGPGWVWQYDSPETKVQVLCYPPEALKAQDDNARDLRMKLMESLCVVLMDPEAIPRLTTISGKALQVIKQRQVDRCDTYRNDFESGFLEPSIAMQLRIIRKLAASMRVSGIAKFAAILAKFDTAAGWIAPAFQVKWGEYFSPDPTEQAQIVTMVQAAYVAGLITMQLAVEKIKDIFDIENVSEIVTQLEKAKADAKAEMAATMANKPSADNADSAKESPPEPNA